MRPYITQEIKEKVWEVLESGHLTEGPITNEFENMFRNYLGCRHAIAVTSCTVGLEISLRALGIGPGDEVIVPDYTYPATAAVLEIVGARIVLVDVNPETMLIDYDAVESAVTPQTKALIPVSLFGNPLDYDRLNQIKEKYHLFIIEDAACSIGSEYKGIRVGNQADISVFSLHPRKFITTGEGGVVTTENSEWAEWMLSYKHFGMRVLDYRLSTSFERIGANYKMSDILAAVGLVQMRHIGELLEKRIALAETYLRELKNTPGIRLPLVTPEGQHSYQSCCVFDDNRDDVMAALAEKGIQTQIGNYALHTQKAFNENLNCRIHGNMEGSTYAFKYCLTLPMYHDMTDEDQQYVIDELKALPFHI